MTPNRRQAVSYGKITRGEQTMKTLPSLTTNSSDNLPSAYCKQGEVFKYRTPEEMFRFMIASQSKQLSGHTILEKFPNKRMHVHLLDLLLKQYQPEVIGKAILKASFYCKHPYSVRLIKYFCKRITDNGNGVCGSEQGQT